MSISTFQRELLADVSTRGSVLDLMSRRPEGLAEAEVLKIMADVCEGVAAMHNCQPALLHRDLKVENILRASDNYKLCGFGSAVSVSRCPPQTLQEIQALEADLLKHTTIQYRAPEMFDLYIRRSIDEKSDVWALGVLLYKLCYYTTPYDMRGQEAIWYPQQEFPSYPVYSQQLKDIIGMRKNTNNCALFDLLLTASMLNLHGVLRPTVRELLETMRQMNGRLGEAQ